MHMLTSKESGAFFSSVDELLQGRLFFQPTIIVFLRHDFEICLHVVVPQATKLAADNFVFANLGCGEMERKIQSRNKILVHSQRGNVERMPEILGVHEQVDFFVDRDSHLSGYNVVLGIGIVVGIETKEILCAFVDQLGMSGAEFSIRTGITKIKRELSGLHLNRDGVSRGRREINLGPSLHSEDSQRQDFRSYQ